MSDEIDTEEVANNEEYNPPITDYEHFITLNQLKGYDEKKGTAVVDVDSLPTTVENRTYRLNKDDSDPLQTKIWVKGTEMETKAQADELSNHYVKYVTALPSPIDTDVVYGIDHTYSQDVDSKYLVQDFISTYMKKQSNNAWLLNDSVTSTYATITYEDTDYEFNKLYWTGKRYVTYIWDESTGTSTRVGDFGINIGDLWNYKLTWNYQHKDYYVSDSTNAKTTQLANMEQVQDWYLKKEELGKANGVAVLDGDGKIPKNELNFTALNYLGMTHTWPTDSDPEAGDFYIVDEEFTHDTTTLEPGDWIIYFTSWEVESNNVIVSSVNGKIGTVVLTGDDINVTYEDVTDTLNNTLPKLGKLKTVNSIEPDDDGNVDVDSMQLTYLADCNDVSDVTVDRQMKTYYITSATTNRPGTLSNYGVLTIYRVRSDLYVENYYEAEVGYIYSRYYKTDTWYNWTKKPFQAIRDFGSTSTDVFAVLSSYLDGLMTKANLIIKGKALVNNPDGSTGTSFLYILDSSSNANYAVCKAYNLGKGLEYVSYLSEGTWGVWSSGGTVKSVNNISPDTSGNVNVDSMVLTYLADCNDVSDLTTDRQTKIYYVTTSTTNTPSTSVHGVFTIYRINSNWFIERLFDNSSSSIYMRSYNGSWGSWSKLSPVQSWVGTASEYAALTSLDSNTVYYIREN